MHTLNNAEKQAARMKDEYTSAEHILMALVDEPSTADILKRQRIHQEAILKALTSIRGSQRITSQNPESTYQSLEKFGRDLTAMARQASLTLSSAATRRSAA
jgi:ATP-dependent Clp protease ATP-binding subunit ClpB